MSRVKKSRSLKRVTGGVKTGSKERTKLENKQRKAKQKAAKPFKPTRQRSVYQQFMDENNLVEKQQANNSVKSANSNQQAPVKKALKPKKEAVAPVQQQVAIKSQENANDLWDQLEQPTNKDTF
ncbi:MAG: hypothetical protein ACJA1U_002666 [Bermanella sp.]|jgi:hypothetical protein